MDKNKVAPEELRPIYKYEFNPNTREIVKHTITDYTVAWGGRRLGYKDGKASKRIFLKDFEVFSHGRIFTYEDDIQEVRDKALRGLWERIDNYEANIRRLKQYIKAFENFKE